MPRPAVAVIALAAVALLGAVPASAAPAPPQRSWSTDAVRVPDARAPGLQGRGVLVAVLDSWVDRSHPDFGGRVRRGADCLSGTCRPGQAADGCDHGTHVAGTLAASSFGVAPAVEVLPVRVLAVDPRTRECVGTPADVAAGIRWAVQRGARVLNLSLGAGVAGQGGGSAIPAAVEQARRAGVLVVFSAGNDDLPVADAYDGSAVVVAATGPTGELASYSQHGRGVTLAAPGGDADGGTCTPATCVTSLFPRGRYAVAAGTSMAAPLVSDVAALLLAQDPTRTPEELTRLLTSTARPLEGAGAGLLDAAAALGAATRPSAESRAAAAPRSAPAPRAADPSPVPPPAASPPAPPPLAAPPTAPPVPVGLGLLAAALVVLGGGGVVRATRRPGRSG